MKSTSLDSAGRAIVPSIVRHQSLFIFKDKVTEMKTVQNKNKRNNTNDEHIFYHRLESFTTPIVNQLSNLFESIGHIIMHIPTIIHSRINPHSTISPNNNAEKLIFDLKSGDSQDEDIEQGHSNKSRDMNAVNSNIPLVNNGRRNGSVAIASTNGKHTIRGNKTLRNQIFNSYNESLITQV